MINYRKGDQTNFKSKEYQSKMIYDHLLNKIKYRIISRKHLIWFFYHECEVGTNAVGLIKIREWLPLWPCLRVPVQSYLLLLTDVRVELEPHSGKNPGLWLYSLPRNGHTLKSPEGKKKKKG